MSLPNRYMHVSPGPEIPDIVHAIVEIPKGRRSKFEVDKETGIIRLDRYLYSSAHYPGDYGFIPQTLAEDGDPLDVLVMVNEPTFSGCLIEARVLGLFRMTDKGDNDFKVLAVPNTDPIFSDYRDMWRVPPHYLREVEHFFGTYKQLEGNNMVETLGWEGADAARHEIEACIERYKQSHKRRATDPDDADMTAQRQPAVRGEPAKPEEDADPTEGAQHLDARAEAGATPAQAR